LGRAEGWKYKDEYEYELSTMPGWAGSSWYFYRYMDSENKSEFASKEALDYWQNVDIYVGGTEHAVGHLLYSRFWNHFMYDLGLIPQKEYAAKLINQGMIQGRSLYIKLNTGRRLHVDVNLADEKDRMFRDVFIKMVEKDNRFEGINTNTEGGDIDWEKDENGKLFANLTAEIEKMSKRTLNVVNPDDMVEKYGADCFRMYEMFLGPLEDSKPWSTTGITGVQGFLRKLWSLFYDLNTGKNMLDNSEPTKEEYKALHKCIKKVSEDIERFSFNTCVSSFMICANELKDSKCHKPLILKELVTMVAPFAPFVAEELNSFLGNKTSVLENTFPTLNESYLVESEIVYPISINGKKRGEATFSADAKPADIEAEVRAMEVVKKWTEDDGKDIKKVIIVPGRMVNIVV
jgi:leucyl-tRNA synthetase